MVFLKAIISLSFTVSTVLAATASTIASCPALPARTTAAKDVTDLRIDDIKVVAALGDSIMAGFGMMGVDYEGTGLLNLSTLLEFRGNSYGIGGDTGAITLANFVKRYNPNVQGASVLSHIASFCNADSCGFPATVCKLSTVYSCKSITSNWSSLYRSTFKRQFECCTKWWNGSQSRL